VRRSIVALLSCVLIATASAPGAFAQSTPVPETADGPCSVRVAAVAPLDASEAVWAVVVEPTVAGSGVLSGSLALFTSRDRRYDVRFENGVIRSDAPLVLTYRFPAAVVITGAYVATLDTPSPGPCSIVAPWVAKVPSDALADHGIAAATVAGANDALPVTDPGRADPLTCRVPTGPAHIVRAEPPEVTFFDGNGGMPEGSITVQVVVTPDGHAFDVHLDRVEGNLDELASGTTFKQTVLRAAMKSTYAAATFRCRPMIGIAYYHFQITRAR
jgi:hypothetical protein